MARTIRRPRMQERPASQQRGKTFLYTLGAAGLIFAIVLLYVGFKAPDNIPGRGYYTIRAQFNDADNIANHGQVRINGHLVGQVLSLKVRDGKAQVDLQIDPEYGPLKSDTTVEVRPRSPVGVRYIDIKPGTRGTNIPKDGLIPAQNSRSTVQLDTVLGTFDPDTRVRARQFLRGLGGGFADRGDDLNQAYGVAPKFLEDTQAVVGAIADRKGATRTFIRGGGLAADAADPVRQTIADGFKPEADSIRPFYERADSVHRLLEQAPPSFQTVTAQLPATTRMLDELAGFARNVRPVLQASPTAFSQTAALLSESRPGLVKTTKTLKTLGTATPPFLALLATVKPVLPNLDQTLADTTPLAKALGVSGCDLLSWGERWSSAELYGNSTGNWLRFNVVSGAGAVYGLNKDIVKQAGGKTNPYPAPCTAINEKSGGN